MYSTEKTNKTVIIRLLKNFFINIPNVIMSPKMANIKSSVKKNVTTIMRIKNVGYFLRRTSSCFTLLIIYLIIIIGMIG